MARTLRNFPAVSDVYRRLFAHYGAQGWWPLLSRAGRRGYDSKGYHPGRYGIPRTAEQRFEVGIGAVLTQNTSWTNAEAALRRLLHQDLLRRDRLLERSEEEIAQLIRPSGYFNQKARKLWILAQALGPGKTPERSGLLGLWGIGEETADSILLYAYHRPLFVVDVYSRRLAQRLGWISGREPYAQLQRLFSEALPARAELYGEYHALIVRHAKEHCRKRPLCAGCPLLQTVCPGALA
jgi:endonuclease-3 related protein